MSENDVHAKSVETKNMDNIVINRFSYTVLKTNYVELVIRAITYSDQMYWAPY